MCSGCIFHSLGPLTLNEHAANVCFVTLGTNKILLKSFDHNPSLLAGSFTIRSCKNNGAVLKTHLCTRLNILKDICSLMFNQCRSASACVELEYLSQFKINLAHMFCIHWNFLMSQSGRPTKMAL